MEQSANPVARVGHHTRTVSSSTQNASIWSLTAAAPSDSVFCALCTNLLAYLLLTAVRFKSRTICIGPIRITNIRSLVTV